MKACLLRWQGHCCHQGKCNKLSSHASWLQKWMPRQQARDGGQAGKSHDGNSVQMYSKWPAIWCLGWFWHCFPLAWLPGHPNKLHQDDRWETLHWRRTAVAALGDRLIFSLVLLHPTMSYFACWRQHRQQAHFLGEIIEKIAPMLGYRRLWGRIDVDAQ